jgi:2,4-dienoyl-CoA reductase-like NADH-dependent reductase (Old Yellow Enzyme family)
MLELEPSDPERRNEVRTSNAPRSSSADRDPNPCLFSTITVGALTLRNRVAVSPMTRVSAAEDGRATAQMVAYYETFARGGWGLVETEATYVDEEYSQCRDRQPGLATAVHRDAWRRVVEAVHARGAAIFVQLQHAGALAESRRHRPDSLAPSPIEPRGRRPLATPREATHHDIVQIQASFAAAAVRAVEAGFDGVELHGSNGYLIDQFLTDYTNRRADEYGGSVENRVRFAAETVRVVRGVVPDGFPVGIRLMQGKSNDPDYAWPGGEEDAVAIFRAVVAAGASFLHLGGLHAESAGRVGGPRLAALAKEVTAAAVIANGGLEDPVRAEHMLRAGRADVVSLARGALANPDWPQRVGAGLSLARYDPAMVLPVATLDNAEAWQQRQS